MKIDNKVNKIVNNALEGSAPSKKECIYLLGFKDNSLEALHTRASASAIIRNRNDNSGVIYGQIGVEAFPCEANCTFCAFGESHTQIERTRIDKNKIAEKVNSFCQHGDLYGLYLMTMHKYDIDFFIEVIEIAKKHLHKSTNLYANVGDTNYEDFKAMKEAGLSGVYHVCRLGEGKYTQLDPDKRKETMDNAQKAGLNLLDCLEPIGTEHSPEELVENMFIGIDRNCIQTGAMRRIAVPGTPLARYGQITEFRLSQIVAVLALATLKLNRIPNIGVHEPNQIGYASGANLICAETGVNPRDNNAETSENRGIDVSMCREMLYESGYTKLRCGDESKIPLTAEYIKKCKV